MDFKQKDCPNCYLKGGPTHRYQFHWGTEHHGTYSHLIELMQKADVCRVAKAEVDRAIQCLRDVPREFWYDGGCLHYVEIGCPSYQEDPRVTVKVDLPSSRFRSYGKTFYGVDELRQAADELCYDWVRENDSRNQHRTPPPSRPKRRDLRLKRMFGIDHR
jgi:hypothetical protein